MYHDTRAAHSLLVTIEEEKIIEFRVSVALSQLGPKPEARNHRRRKRMNVTKGVNTFYEKRIDNEGSNAC